MAGSSEIKVLLFRHKASLLHELNSSNLLNVLVKRGIISEIDRDAVGGNSVESTNADIDLFIEMMGAKGFDAFREFCFALEEECPHVLTNLLVDQHNVTGEHYEHETFEDENLSIQTISGDNDDRKFKNAVPKCSNTNSDENGSSNEIENMKVNGEPSLTHKADDDDDNKSNDIKLDHHRSESLIKECPDNNDSEGQWKIDFPDEDEHLDEPVDEPIIGDRGWEVHHVTVTRVPGYGFGIAVSGGRDNPHFTNGDPAIAISDVLKAGPAEGKLQVNDRIISANGVSLEGADYGAAVRVLRDSGSTVLLVVKRRSTANNNSNNNNSNTSANIINNNSNNSNNNNIGPQIHRLTLTRNNKKDDFGIVLGCKLYVKEVTRELSGAKPGDFITKIGGVTADNMSLKEAKKIMDQCKDRLSVIVSREFNNSINNNNNNNSNSNSNNYNHSKNESEYLSGASYSSQNLYVPPPTRQQQQQQQQHQQQQHQQQQQQQQQSPLVDDKSNLVPRGRSRGPLMDVSLSQLDLPATPTVDPPRPPPPRLEDYYSTRRQLYDEDPLSQRSKQPMPDPRFITFQKEGSVGVRLTGGNETGVFVTAVQPGSPASLQGLQPGDKILKVNDMDMKGVTREEAVLFLLSLQEQIDLIVQHRRQEYDQIILSGRGDSFHIKTHFHYEQPEKGEMSFRSGDVFHVVDTLHNGVVGSWQVFRIGRNNQEVQKGIIPNKARGEELATAQFNATKKELSSNESRGNFFRRRRGSHRRSKSLGRDHWDDVVFSDSVSKFPAYERVVLRHPGFIRPVILFGPVADLARDKLLKDYPDKFTSPQMENQIEEEEEGGGGGSGGGGKRSKTSGIIRLSAIREVMDRGKHALLDITPNAVDRLNYAQFYPIVIFLKAESKQIIKEMRAGIPKSAHKSSKKLLDQCQKLDKVWGHIFSAVITLSTPEAWYRKLREIIDRQQQGPLWMSQTKPEEALSDDFLFPMTSRLSYASSPESDLELSPVLPLPGSLGPPARLKSSSDPSIATQDDTSAPPPYTSSYQMTGGPTDIKYGFSSSGNNDQYAGVGMPPTLSPLHSQGPPDLPPRIDRNIKPSQQLRGTVGRSAVDRLVNKTDSMLDMDYINATPHRVNATSSLEQPQPKTGSYDSVSSYDSYNNSNGTNLNTSTGNRLGPNVPDDLKSGNQKPHDPYRFTRSTAQPIPPQENIQTRADYAKYSIRPVEHKAMAVPSGKAGNNGTGTYKPIPPPKPKNYRPPQQQIIQDENISGGNVYQHTKSYSMSRTGMENNVNVQRNSGQYYYNVPSSNRNNDGNYLMNSNHTHNHTQRHNREPSGLDLAGSRERGSAFELYRKPPLIHHQHHNIRNTWVARGIFDIGGGKLEGSCLGGVSLTIPPGAIKKNKKQEIYLTVTYNKYNQLQDGEYLLSPFVECGPRGIKFLVPVELKIPHNASPKHQLALKTIDSNQCLNIQLPEPSNTSNTVVIKLDHF